MLHNDCVRQSARPAWRVLLIGGNTSPLILPVARTLASHFQCSLLLADDFRLVIQQTSTPAGQPGIHYLPAHPTIWHKSPEALCDGFITTGNALANPLASVVLRHADAHMESTAAPIILAGINVVPGLATHPLVAPHTPGGTIRPVFLDEEDETTILRDLVSYDYRAIGTAFSPRLEQTLVRAHWLYGRWLQRQAGQHSLPIISSHPRDTLFARLLDTLTN